MKKNKLNLKELRVKSFVTSGDEMNAETVKGGALTSGIATCGSNTLPGSFLCAYTQHTCDVRCDNYTEVMK